MGDRCSRAKKSKCRYSAAHFARPAPSQQTTCSESLQPPWCFLTPQGPQADISLLEPGFRDLRVSRWQLEQRIGDGFLFDILVFARHLERRALAIDLDHDLELLRYPLVLSPHRLVVVSEGIFVA